MPRMITEEFSFPIITGDNCNNVVHLTVLPPLWTRSPSYSCSASDHHHIIRRNKFFTRSFSHVETQLLLLKTQTREDVEFVETTETETEIAEEKMDMLWEDFNSNESLVPHPQNDHHRLQRQRQSPAVSVFSSPTCSSSPVVDLETMNHTSLSLSPLPSSDPHPITIMANTNCGDEKGKGKEQKLAGAGAPRGGSFEGELETRSRSNSLVMIVPKESKKMSKKKKKKKKKEVVQESIVRMMKKFFLLKNISAFKFHKKKN